MAPKHAHQPKRKPALKDLRSFEGSHHLTRVMKDAMVGEPPSLLDKRDKHRPDLLGAYATKLEHDGPGFGASPDLIKIDARNGQGLLMDYDVNLNMKTELTMVGPSPSVRQENVR